MKKISNKIINTLLYNHIIGNMNKTLFFIGNEILTYLYCNKYIYIFFYLKREE